LATARAVSSGASAGALKFVFETVAFALVAHAMGYLAHEYAHSIFAWALGWMKEPFGIDYGHASLNNFIFSMTLTTTSITLPSWPPVTG
jgi:hypothetical protein